jgi:hypothetical protein
VSSIPVSPVPSRVPARIGLVLAAVLAVLQLVTYIPMFGEEIVMPAVLTAVNVAALAATVPAWRGAVWARVAVVVATVISALTALPAFFIPGVPVEGRIAASVGILLALGVTVLLLPRADRPARRSPTREGALTALVAGVVLATGTGSATSAQPLSATAGHSCGIVVHQAPIGSEDMWYPCTVLERHRYGSADTLEHYARLGG